MMESVERSAIKIVLRSLRRQRRILLVCWGLILGFSIAYAFLSKPIYRAELVLAPVESDSGDGLMSSLGVQLGQFASLAGFNIGDDSNIQTHLALLESKEFTREFIVSNNLLPDLYSGDWDSDTGKWKPGREKTMWEVLDEFDRKVRSVNYDATSGIVRLRIDWNSGDLAAKWANNMGNQLNTMIRQRAIREANDSIRYLKDEIGKNSIVGVEQSIYRLIETQISKIMLANVRKDYAFQVIDPAIPPAEDAQLRPNRSLIVAIGLVLGFVFGGFLAVATDTVRNV